MVVSSTCLSPGHAFPITGRVCICARLRYIRLADAQGTLSDRGRVTSRVRRRWKGRYSEDESDTIFLLDNEDVGNFLSKILVLAPGFYFILFFF